MKSLVLFGSARTSSASKKAVKRKVAWFHACKILAARRATSPCALRESRRLRARGFVRLRENRTRGSAPVPWASRTRQPRTRPDRQRSEIFVGRTVCSKTYRMSILAIVPMTGVRRKPVSPTDHGGFDGG